MPRLVFMTLGVAAASLIRRCRPCASPASPDLTYGGENRGEEGRSVPVTVRALVQRINRRLRRDGKTLKNARSPRIASSLGRYFIVDPNRSWITGQHISPEVLGRQIGVLAEWEVGRGVRPVAYISAPAPFAFAGAGRLPASAPASPAPSRHGRPCPSGSAAHRTSRRIG